MLTPNRREFLSLSASAALAAALTRKADAAPDDAPGEWRNKRPGMSYRRLGRTNFMISELICGGNTITPDHYDTPVAAFEMGLNYFDTAQAYGGGKSELGYAKALKAVGRDNVFLTSKASPWVGNRNKELQTIYESLSDAERKKIDGAVADELAARRALDDDYICHYFDSQQPALEASVRANIVEKAHGHRIERRVYKQSVIDSVENSLKRLETDRLDILMAPHAANSRAELTDFPEVFEAFEQLRKQGKVRHLGASSHSDPAGVIEGAVESGVYSVVMLAYNIVNQSYVTKALDLAAKADLGIIAMKVARPVFHGRDNGLPDDPRRQAMIHAAIPGDLHPAQKCYLWALQDSRIAACNSEMKSVEMAKANLPLALRKA